jgi:hypothetical protein
MVENEPDKRRGSRFMTQFMGLPLPGSALVFLPPQILRRARTDCSRPRVLPPSSNPSSSELEPPHIPLESGGVDAAGPCFRVT